MHAIVDDLVLSDQGKALAKIIELAGCPLGQDIFTSTVPLSTQLSVLMGNLKGEFKAGGYPVIDSHHISSRGRSTTQYFYIVASCNGNLGEQSSIPIQDRGPTSKQLRLMWLPFYYGNLFIYSIYLFA